MLTHANLTWNVVNFLTCADFRGDDVTVAIAPFFRVGGTGVNVLPVLFMGGRSWCQATCARRGSCGRWSAIG
jgi:acyl-CoA synthetase (AMP-forming)/AMP-acid ligase II